MLFKLTTEITSLFSITANKVGTPIVFYWKEMKQGDLDDAREITAV